MPVPDELPVQHARMCRWRVRDVDRAFTASYSIASRSDVGLVVDLNVYNSCMEGTIRMRLPVAIVKFRDYAREIVTGNATEIQARTVGYCMPLCCMHVLSGFIPDRWNAIVFDSIAEKNVFMSFVE